MRCANICVLNAILESAYMLASEKDAVFLYHTSYI